MKVIVFGYNSILGTISTRDMKADILRQMKDKSGILFVDNRIELKGVIELSEKDCKQFGVMIGMDVERERGNH